MLTLLGLAPIHRPSRFFRSLNVLSRLISTGTFGTLYLAKRIKDGTEIFYPPVRNGRVPWNIMDNVPPLSVHGQRKCEIHEWIERDRNLQERYESAEGGKGSRNTYLLAFRAHQSALVLALKEIDDNTIVALHISVPRRLS